jgi:hypothetical protein
MKKRIVSLLMSAAMVAALLVPAMAASGMNSNEEDLLNYFSDAIDKYASVLDEKNTGTTEQYKAEARNTLTNDVELDEDACKDLKDAIDELLAFVDGKNITTKKQASEIMDEVVSLANKTANKYGMTITVEHNVKGVADVIVDKDSKYYDGNKDSGNSSKKVSDGTGSKAVKQTGFDTTATVAVSLALVAALGTGFVVVRKNSLLS